MGQLRPEVAERYELTTHTTRLYVQRLEREVDLTRISVDEAEQLLALEGCFEWLKRKPAPAQSKTTARKRRGASS